MADFKPINVKRMLCCAREELTRKIHNHKTCHEIISIEYSFFSQEFVCSLSKSYLIPKVKHFCWACIILSEYYNTEVCIKILFWMAVNFFEIKTKEKNENIAQN